MTLKPEQVEKVLEDHTELLEIHGQKIDDLDEKVQELDESVGAMHSQLIDLKEGQHRMENQYLQGNTLLFSVLQETNQNVRVMTQEMTKMNIALIDSQVRKETNEDNNDTQIKTNSADNKNKIIAALIAALATLGGYFWGSK